VASREGELPAAALARSLAEGDDDFILVIAAGDLLAPDALAAAALAAVTQAADAVAGLRVIFNRTGIAYVDIVSSPPGRLDLAIAMTAIAESGGSAPFKGGEILLSRNAIERAGGIAIDEEGEPIAELWPRLAEIGANIALIGRPVVLQFAPVCSTPDKPRAQHLIVAALNDKGFSGGAGIAHRRLVEALRYAGHRVEVKTLESESGPAAAEWTKHFPRLESEIAMGNFDFVLAGNIHGATRSADVLARVHRHAPVLAVTHDLFLLTGRCAHPEGCTRIVFGCDQFCPTSTYYPQLAPRQIQSAWRDKQKVLATTAPPILIANSTWAADRARALAPPGAAIERIDLAFPTQVFRPRDRATLRRELNLPKDDVLLVFAAVIADASSKGTQDLLSVLRRVARPGVGFVAIGRIDDPGAFRLPNLFTPGPITDEDTLARWYGACDIHVTASQLETLGQTPIEAGLCGTPTVAYRATGLTTAVIDGVTGRLTDVSSEALIKAISDLIEDRVARNNLGAIARIALESRNSHAASYLGLHRILVTHGLIAGPGEVGRIRFSPKVLNSFMCSAAPDPSVSGTVQPAPHAGTRLLRRLKQMIWGRAMPLWARRLFYAAYLLRSKVKCMQGQRI
jgi:glycosyltransferase involved in cell wall biosynthesis